VNTSVGCFCPISELACIENDAQPCAQPDGPACGVNLASVGAARRLASYDRLPNREGSLVYSNQGGDI
jgi:hypothetical protein